MHVPNLIRQNKLLGIVFIVSVLILGSMGASACYSLLRNNNNPFPHFGGPSQSETPLPTEPPREETPEMHARLSESTDPQLRLLAQYEQRLERGFNTNMFFRDMPATTLAAGERAVQTAPVLAEYAKQGIKPLVVFEPEGIDLRALDPQVFKHYFETLKLQGLTDKDMGSWVLLPEPNIPEWGDPVNDRGNTDPALFIKNFTIIAAALKEVFPSAKTVVLLDSATYPSHDIEYTQGSYDKTKLLKYVEGLPPRLVDDIGLQGFPWGEKDGELQYDPATFLDADLTVAVAKRLDVDRVWLNTGTFSSRHDWDPDMRITVTNAQREQMLSGIATQAQKVQKAGYAVTVNLFAEDKSETEANWSYTDDASWQLFQSFADGMRDKGLGLAVFDIPKL